MLPVVIESGKKIEREADFVPEDTIIASVLPSFALSLFTIIQVLTSSLFFGMERRCGI